MTELRSKTSVITQSEDSQLDARNTLWDLFHSPVMSDSEKERNPGLFLRSANLARILALAEIYQEIVQIPGSIADFGTWRGQNFILCENFRAIFEPFNKQRRVYAFDTFEGYRSGEGESQVGHQDFKDGTYSTGAEYDSVLARIMSIHESINVLHNVSSGHQVVKGDILKTLPEVMEAQKNLCFSLAFFDMNLEGPTSFAVETILPRMVPGSRLVFFQMQRDFLPGEGATYINHILHKRPHTIRRSTIYPSVTVIEIS
ncbi:MAG: hypothetical protein KDD64_11335 [Bdellovibrionales bacterium]|nr:hypothetical protein [Bdellovibrionales bacterium]